MPAWWQFDMIVYEVQVGSTGLIRGKHRVMSACHDSGPYHLQTMASESEPPSGWQVIQGNGQVILLNLLSPDVSLLYQPTLSKKVGVP